MPRDCVAIIPAAGSGSRMGGELPKVYLKVGGVTILRRSIDALTASGRVSRLVVCVRKQEIDLAREHLGPIEGLSVIEGGQTRKMSVGNALNHIRSFPGASSLLVAVHDAARCCVSPDIVRRCIAAGEAHGAATAAVPVIDTLKKGSSDGFIVGSVSRDSLWSIQTPQVFDFDLLWQAHLEGPEDATDDTSLVQALRPVALIEGDRRNIKITTPADLSLAEAFIGV